MGKKLTNISLTLDNNYTVHVSGKYIEEDYYPDEQSSIAVIDLICDKDHTIVGQYIQSFDALTKEDPHLPGDYITSSIEAKENGIYTFYRYVVRGEHRIELSPEPSSMVPPSPIAYYYYDNIKNKLYCQHGTTIPDEVTLQEFIDDDKKDDRSIANYNADFFQMCALSHCLMDIQKHYLYDHLRNCAGFGNCPEGKSEKYKMNFLLAAMFVLQHLVRHDSLDEAQDLMDRLSLCGGLCNNMNNDIKEGCGCE